MELILQLLQQVDDLSLNRHIQGGDWLVCYDEGRIDRQRPCNDDSLLLPAAELMGIPILEVRIQAHRLQELFHSFLHLVIFHDPMYPNGLANRFSDRLARIERGRRILEDYLHLLAKRTHLALLQFRQVRPLEINLPLGRLLQLQDGIPQRRLAASTLPDQSKGLSFSNDDVYSIHRTNGPAFRAQPKDDPLGPNFEVRLQASNVDQ